jgi:hypothetical protein
MPRELDPGILYVSKRFQVAGHLCACGCGNKVMTPLGPPEWSFSERGGKPTLKPSIGSWQLACQSHYWITNGEIRWAEKWTKEEIDSGRRAEEERRDAFYDSQKPGPSGPLRSFWSWIRRTLGL